MTFAPPTFQNITTGFVVAIVGFFSSFPVVMQGLDAMGANAAQSASGLMAAAIAMGLSAVFLSLWTRQPISVAWSTPGVALLAVSATPEGGFEAAMGAFLFAGLLTVISGLWKPLNRLANAIPAPLAQAMLSGVLLALCLQPITAMQETPYLALPIILTWFVVGLINRIYAVPAAVVVAAIVVVVGLEPGATFDAPIISSFTLGLPTFDMPTLLGIGLPLYIVTMATQNVPGLAIIRSYGYTPRSKLSLSTVGLSSMLSSLAGAPATCLAAITAAMCANEDSHPDPAQRYWSAVTGGLFYCALGIFAGGITAFAGMAPPQVLGTVAGIALLGVFANSAAAALEQPDYRQSAAITFLITASGITVFGLGAAVWGLLIGGLAQVISNRVAVLRA
jgi:benzoate membrane transport protein